MFPLRRRRPLRGPRRPQPVVVSSTSAHADLVLVPRVERAIGALAGYTQQLEQRIERLERRLDEAVADRKAQTELTELAASEMDEVRAHTHQVASDLTRLAVAISSEIEELRAEIRPASPEPELEPEPVVVDDEPVDAMRGIDPLTASPWPISAG